MILFLAASAYAQDCPEPVTAVQIDGRLDGFDSLLVNDRTDDLIPLVPALKASFLCADRAIKPSAIARFAHDMAIVRFFEQDEDEAVQWAQAAEAAVPGYPWPSVIDPHHPLREMVAAADEPGFGGPTDMALVPPPGVVVFLDGRFIDRPEARVGVPYLVQTFSKGGPAGSWWQDGAAFPDTILGQGTPPKRPGWVWPDEDLKTAIAEAAERYGAPVAATPEKPTCSPMDADAFHARVDAADAALDTDDLIGFGTVYKQLRTDVACLTIAVPREDWARFLVDLAIVENATGQNWQEPLATAIAAHPAVNREQAPPDIRSWTPPAATVLGTDRVPDGATFYVDGRQVATQPDPSGIHLVQRQIGDTWDTRWLRHQPFPADWMPKAPVVAAPIVPTTPTKEPSTALVAPPNVLALVAGFGRAGQDAGVSGTYLATVGKGGAALGLATTGHVPVGPIGLFWDAEGGIDPKGPDGEAWGGLSVGKTVAVDLGGGFATTTLVVADAPQRFLVPQARLGVDAGLPMGPGVLDLGLAAGGSQAGAHVRVRAGLASAEGIGWYAGVELGDDVAWFVQDGVDRSVSASGLHAAARLGLRL